MRISFFSMEMDVGMRQKIRGRLWIFGIGLSLGALGIYKAGGAGEMLFFVAFLSGCLGLDWAMSSRLRALGVRIGPHAVLIETAGECVSVPFDWIGLAKVHRPQKKMVNLRSVYFGRWRGDIGMFFYGDSYPDHGQLMQAFRTRTDSMIVLYPVNPEAYAVAFSLEEPERFLDALAMAMKSEEAPKTP